jgi:arabinofuranosyltransferase
MKLRSVPTGIIISLILLIGASVIHILASSSRNEGWGIDDAYISYRYSRNLSQGNGPVFNVGERVEGYSNFLYVLLISPAFLVTDDLGIYSFAAALNLIFVAAAFVVYYNYLKWKYSQPLVVPACLLFALSPALWAAVASGLETPLVIFFQVVIWTVADQLATDGRRNDLFILCGAMILSVLARADGFIVPIVAIVYLMFRKRYCFALGCTLVLFGTFAVYVLWRYQYYGYPLPNTYYVKVSGPLEGRMAAGFRQMLGVLLFQGGLASGLALMLAVMSALRTLAMEKWRALQRVPLELLLGFTLLGYWIYVGGDVFAERFLIILLPIGISLFLRNINNFEGVRRSRLLIGFMVLYLTSQGIFVALDQRFVYSWNKYDRWMSVGLFLRERYKTETIAVDGAGKIPFYSRLASIDMLGLNDEYLGHKPVDFFLVGHNKFDADYVLSRHPDLIATFIDSNLNLNWGMDTTKYSAAGYRLRYLVSEDDPLDHRNIIDVGDLPQLAIINLVRQGFTYAILDRQPIN